MMGMAQAARHISSSTEYGGVASSTTFLWRSNSLTCASVTSAICSGTWKEQQDELNDQACRGRREDEGTDQVP